MKILHLCLGSFYIDNYNYQENMLPKFHAKMGHEVEIVASLISFDKNGNECLIEKGSSYINEYGIPVKRLDFCRFKGAKKLKCFIGTYDALRDSEPDILFIHGCQFWDMKYVVKYLKSNPRVKVYVDNHADFSNSATNWLSKNILHKVLWKKCTKMIEPYTTKFYGVLPARVDFLINMYKLPKEKVELLVMGADDEAVAKVKNDEVIDSVRRENGIKVGDFFIVTGGKIDLFKPQTLLLMEAVNKMPNVKLLVFGSVVPELKEKFNSLCSEKVKYIGWINSEESYKYFAAADLVVFPGRHSVFWEEVAALGIPMIVKYWEGTTHIDMGGNVRFLYKDSAEEIEKEILYVMEHIGEMKKIAQNNAEKFLYSDIARRSIEEKKDVIYSNSGT